MMPDISRSDSNRSDASRPRVSFNRDVHVKRINGPRTANAYSLSSDGSTFVPTSVRRERPRTKKEMTEEAEAVLKQVDKLSCTASSNVKLDEGNGVGSGGEPRPAKVKKKRKESFLKSFTWKNSNSQAEKAKASSSDVDSSSQEYRVYRVNSPSQKSDKAKSYDFMSLDRKKLKREKRNKNLEYLSLEREDQATLDNMLKDKKGSNKGSVMSVAFDKTKNNAKPPKLVCNIPPPDDQLPSKKKQPLSPIIESPRVIDYHDTPKQRENNIDKMIKKLTEKNLPKLSKNTGPIGVKAPQSDTCHNDNRPFSYTNGLADKCDGLDGAAITESLDGHGGEDVKPGSPTSDVIYAQVLVGRGGGADSGAGGNAQRTATVQSRASIAEVAHVPGRTVVVGDSNQSQAGFDYKIDSVRIGDDVCETVNCDDMWKTRSDFREERLSPQSELYGENPGRRELYRRSNEAASRSSPLHDPVRTIRVERQARSYAKSPTDLRDLSIRREILLSRSESQAKERFNSLKRLQAEQPTTTTTTTTTTIKRKIPATANGGIKSGRPEPRYIGDDTRINDLYATSLRKIPKDVELIQPVRTRREVTATPTPVVTSTPVKQPEKEQSWKGFGKAHAIITEDKKHTKVSKSKSFMEQDKPRNKRMDKVKMLFKKGKGSESEDDPLTSRYMEYRGSDLELSDRSTDSSPRRSTTNLHHVEENVIKKTRVGQSQSSPMGTMTRLKNTKNKESHWLKPLEKISTKSKTKNRADDMGSDVTGSSKPAGLRFFGDTDQESTANDQDFSTLKYKYGLHRGTGKMSDSDDDQLTVPTRPESRMTDSTLKGSASGGKYKMKYDLDRPDYGLKMVSGKDEYVNSNMSDTSTLKNLNYDYDLNGLKYGPSISRSSTSVTPTSKYAKEKLRNMKSNPIITVTEPEESLSRRVKSHGNLYSQDEGKRGRRRFYDSSAESTTEGDSSQHSSKSMIYLHAATVGDIPGPRNVYRSDRRSQSREELSSIGDGTILAPNKKALSRSFSVLAPWRPKHNKEDRVLHYDTNSPTDNFHGKPPAGPVKSSKRSLSRERKHNELQFNTLGKENRRRKDLIR